MGKNTPYVSVVMTSYNRDKYIGQAIESILKQECSFPYEIIIGDDCSKDGSRAILAGYKEKYPDVVVLNLQAENVGFGPNWASTVKMARGKYVAFLDDDDYYCDVHRLQTMVEYMDEQPECGLVHTNYYRLYEETGETQPNNAKDATGEDQLIGMYKGTYPLCFGTCMLRNDLIKQYVPLDDYIRFNFPIQDWPTCMLLAQHTEFKYINQLSYVYRKYKGSMSNPQEYETLVQKYGKEKVMYKYISEQVSIPFDEKGWNSYVNHLLMSLAYKRGDYKEAKKYAKLCDEKSMKVLCAYTWGTFQVFRLLKGVRRKV